MLLDTLGESGRAVATPQLPDTTDEDDDEHRQRESIDFYSALGEHAVSGCVCVRIVSDVCSIADD